VRQRFEHFLLGLTRRLSALAPGADAALVRRAAGEALGALPPADYGGVPVESLGLQLVFRHDCRCAGSHTAGRQGATDAWQERVGRLWV
jgi:hypothetical protein